MEACLSPSDALTEWTPAQTVIRSVLTRLAEEKGITILFATENGSRAWGFASPDSDHDVRFVYRYKNARDYLRLSPRPDVIERQIPATHPDLYAAGFPYDIELQGWDLLKALALFRKSNPALIEWLTTPTRYWEEGPVAARLQGLLSEGFDRKALVWHYWNMARNQVKNYLQDAQTAITKKYLYAVRPLVCIRYLEQHDTLPPSAFRQMLREVDLDRMVRIAIVQLILRKTRGEALGRGERLPILDAWIAETLAETEAWANTLTGRDVPEAPLNALLWEELGL